MTIATEKSETIIPTEAKSQAPENPNKSSQESKAQPAKQPESSPKKQSSPNQQDPPPPENSNSNAGSDSTISKSDDIIFSTDPNNKYAGNSNCPIDYEYMWE